MMVLHVRFDKSKTRYRYQWPRKRLIDIIKSIFRRRRNYINNPAFIPLARADSWDAI